MIILEMTLGQRLKELRLSKNLTLQAVGDKVSKSKQMISYYEEGKSQPAFDVLSKMAELFGVTMSDLVEPIDSNNPSQVKNNRTEDTIDIEETHSPYNGIDRGSSSIPNMWVVPAKAQGGFILGFRNRMFKHMLDRVPFPQINGECFSFEIEGFSMYPAYNPGATIVCTFIPDRSWLRKGKTYVFQTNDGLVIKNFDRVEDGKIYLESENPAYNPVDPISTDELVQLYEIEYVISKPPNKGV